jgi:hypothetical protein
VKRRGLAYVCPCPACRYRSRSPAGPGAGLPHAVASASPAHAYPRPDRRRGAVHAQAIDPAHGRGDWRALGDAPGGQDGGPGRGWHRMDRLGRRPGWWGVCTPPSRSCGKDQPARARSSRLARARTRSASGIAPSASMLSVIDPGGVAALVPDQARHVAPNLPSDFRLRCARPCTTTRGILPYSGRLDQISLGRISALTPSPD